MLAISALTFVCARALGAGRAGALLGSAWFFATVALAFPVYAGMNDPSLYGLAVSCAGFVIFFKSSGATGRYLGVATMALAGFVKLNLIALPIVALWRAFEEDPRQASRLSVFGVAFGLSLLGVARAVYGENLLPQLLSPRVFNPWTPLTSLTSLQWVAPVWPFWFFCAPRDTQSIRSRRLVTRLGIVSLAAWAFWRMGAGVDDNVEFDLVFATALALALAVEWLHKREGAVALLCCVVVARLATTPERGPWLWATSADYRRAIERRDAVAKAEIARVSEIPGAVACSMQSLCFRAGKAFVYNDFAAAQRLATGRVSAQDFESEKAAVRFEKIDPLAHWPANM
jgi:hypothetical protein